jgi:hypothetical protein
MRDNDVAAGMGAVLREMDVRERTAERADRLTEALGPVKSRPPPVV